MVFPFTRILTPLNGSPVCVVINPFTVINFHLIAEFKWGSLKFPPRQNAVRDNGICYHVGSNDKVWPRSIECQIQEGDCGDFWLIDSVTAVVDGILQGPTKNTRVIKKIDAENPSGEWNRIEIITSQGKCTHIVNGWEEKPLNTS